MSVRKLKVVALIGISLAWCAVASAGDKPKTGFVNKTFTDKEGKMVPYVVYVPKGYDGKKSYPVILFLHGGGEKKPIPWGLGTYIQARGDLDFLCVFPHTEDEGGWEPGSRGDSYAITALDHVMGLCKADAKRVYLTGFSMGGRGTWGLGAKYADRWAALVPVAADSKPEWAERVKDIPIWAFHGAKDDSELTAAKGRQAVEYVKKLGGKPKYTEFPNGGHEPDHAYHNDDLYAWAKKQSKDPKVKKNPAVGDWVLKQPSEDPAYVKSTLHITEKAGKLEVQQVGKFSNNTKSTIASCKDGLLVIHWEASNKQFGDWRGYWVLNLNPEHTKGSGRTVIITIDDTDAGKPQDIEGRKVRVIEGVTIERIAPNRPKLDWPK
jgi:poly(3-hydroxybutyrate) depolymerase